MQQSLFDRGPAPVLPPPQKPAPVPPKPAQAAVPPVKPRRRTRVFLSHNGVRERGHHCRYDRPGHVTCPHCAMTDLPGNIGARCPVCGAVVTVVEEE